MLSVVAASVSTPDSSAAVMIWNAMNHTALLNICGEGGRGGRRRGERGMGEEGKRVQWLLVINSMQCSSLAELACLRHVGKLMHLSIQSVSSPLQPRARRLKWYVLE